MSDYPAIDSEFEALCPPLTSDELALLKASVKREGFRDKLTVWDEENILIDGHNRTRIAEELGIMESIPYRCQSFSSRDAAKLWILENQLGRRNLNDFQRCRIAREMEGVIAAMAKQRQAATQAKPGEQAHRRAVESLPPPTEDESRKTRDIVAEKAGVSGKTYEKAKRIMDSGSPELQRAVESEEISIHGGAKLCTLSKETQAQIVKAEPSERKALIKAASEIAQPVEIDRDELVESIVDPLLRGCDESARQDTLGVVRLICMEVVNAVGRFCPGSLKGVPLLDVKQWADMMEMMDMTRECFDKWQGKLEKERAKS